ncbi:MAG: hypothetical protein A2Z24_02595, partial [Candidatus Woykebacteria bacterium RBG_16_44_10]
FKWLYKELPIKFLGEKFLKEKCSEFQDYEFNGKEIKKLSEKLIETLEKYRKKTGMGRGLAANQIGVNKRMFVIWLREKAEIVINPKVVKLEGLGSYWESCISLGSLLVGEVIRPWRGVFKYKDLEGNGHTLKADEKTTRVFLHELDHLNGETCLDKYERGTVKFVTGGKEEVLGYKFKRLE